MQYRYSFLSMIPKPSPNQMQLWKNLSMLMLLLLYILAGTGGLKVPQKQPEFEDHTCGLSEPALPRRALVSLPAPEFEGTAVVNNKLVPISLSQYAGKYVVLLFYPLDFSSICPSEIQALSDRIKEFRKLNAEVIACSVDSPYSHLAWMRISRREGGLGDRIKIPLLSDLTHKISMDYGVYMPELGHSLGGLFIIDPKRIIRHATLNDLSIGRSVDEVLRLIHACSHVDATGEPCGVNWQPKGRRKHVLKRSDKKPKKYPATKTNLC